jgi:hypothetical protein
MPEYERRHCCCRAKEERRLMQQCGTAPLYWMACVMLLLCCLQESSVFASSLRIVQRELSGRKRVSCWIQDVRYEWSLRRRVDKEDEYNFWEADITTSSFTQISTTWQWKMRKRRRMPWKLWKICINDIMEHKMVSTSSLVQHAIRL